MYCVYIICVAANYSSCNNAVGVAKIVLDRLVAVRSWVILVMLWRSVMVIKIIWIIMME